MSRALHLHPPRPEARLRMRQGVQLEEVLQEAHVLHWPHAAHHAARVKNHTRLRHVMLKQCKQSYTPTSRDWPTLSASVAF